jgi:hypothetical protein
MYVCSVTVWLQSSHMFLPTIQVLNTNFTLEFFCTPKVNTKAAFHYAQYISNTIDTSHCIVQYVGNV